MVSTCGMMLSLSLHFHPTSCDELLPGEALFLLDSSAATCPPQLQVTNHGLSVKNTLNKKWSTIRSTVRLSSGIHRWEVVIDR